MYRVFSVLLVLTGFSLMFFSPLHSQAQDQIQVAVVYNQSGQQGELSYLVPSIRPLLNGRLSADPMISVTETNMSSEVVAQLRSDLDSSPAAMVAKLAVEWLLEVMITEKSQGLTISVQLYSKNSKTSVPEPIITHIIAANKFLPSIGMIVDETVSIVSGSQQTESADVEPQGSDLADDGMSAFRTPHPERDYKKGLYGGAGLLDDDNNEQFTSRGVRKSPAIPLEIETMVLADLDGDGGNEVIAASRSKIRAYKFADMKFQQIASYDFPPNIKIHSMHAAKLAGDDQVRIYVSANRGRFPHSAILDWDGTGDLNILKERINWYIRPVFWPGKGMILAGQKDSPNISDDFLQPGVFELNGNPVKGSLKRGMKLLLPEKTNLFDFVVDDFNGDGTYETVTLDDRELLNLYNETLDLIWVSSASYGGSKRFFGPSIEDAEADGPEGYSEKISSRRTLVFIPGRLDAKDITGDGIPEIVVSTHGNNASRFLANTRVYDGGSVACLTWRQGGLIELWRTSRLEGYVADYGFDTVGEALPEEENAVLNRLFVAQVPAASLLEKILPGGVKSRILAYEIKSKQP